MNSIDVFYEATPNPQAMKFVVTAQICFENVAFADSIKAQRSPLASKLFGFPWAQEIMIGPNFVTVVKQNWVEWSVLAEPLALLIKEHLVNGEPVLLEQVEGAEANSNDVNENDSEIVKQIKAILNEEIRPAVAMDGGDIAFEKFEDGILQLKMQGACSSCPSSLITLKDGIETQMRARIPEVKEVVSI